LVASRAFEAPVSERELLFQDFQDEFLDAIAQLEMLRLYDANGPGLLQLLALRGLAMRKPSRSGSLGKARLSPLVVLTSRKSKETPRLR